MNIYGLVQRYFERGLRCFLAGAGVCGVCFLAGVAGFFAIVSYLHVKEHCSISLKGGHRLSRITTIAYRVM